VILQDEKVFKKYAQKHQLQITDYENSHQKSFPKPLENYLKKTFEN
jgi:A/G-specific adenine glycosylase